MCKRESPDDREAVCAGRGDTRTSARCEEARLEIDIVIVDETWNWYDIERLLRQRERMGWLHLLDTAIITQSPPPELKPKHIAFWRPMAIQP